MSVSVSVSVRGKRKNGGMKGQKEVGTERKKFGCQFSHSTSPQVHLACRDALEMNQKTCTYRDLWHMILLPKAVTHRLAIRSHMEEDSNEHADGGE